tara:strand:+ start:2081 stop:4051 length:1971 start_codon:yes stop_codon:yes gene_type:complete
MESERHLWVKKEHHPMHCGKAGKLYFWYDRVTPLTDSMDMMYRLGTARNKLEELMCNASFSDSTSTWSTSTAATAGVSEPPVRWSVPVETNVPSNGGPVREKAGQPKDPVPGAYGPGAEAQALSFNALPNPDRYFSGEVDLANRTAEEVRARVEDAAEPRKMVCPGCQTERSAGDRSTFELTPDRDAWVCKCGTVVCGLNLVHTSREKNCEESEDKTKRGDVVYEPRSNFSQPAPSAEESRKQRAREQANSYMDPKTAKRLNIGFQQQAINRRAAAEARRDGDVTTSNPYGWTPAEHTKSDSLQRALEVLITQYKPIPMPIQEYLRSETTRLWCRVVTHERVCCGAGNGRQCKKKLSSRTIRVIAGVAFHYHIDRLVHYASMSMAGQISHEAVRDLAERVAADKQHLNAHQVSTRSMVSLFMEKDVSMPCMECEVAPPSPPPPAPADAMEVESEAPVALRRCVSPSLVESGGGSRSASTSPNRAGCKSKKPPPIDGQQPPRFARVMSDVNSPCGGVATGQEGDPSTGLLALKQSIARVHKLMSAVIPASVRDAAVKLIVTDLEFASKVRATEAMVGGQIAKMAFAIMVTINEARSEHQKLRAARPDMSSVTKILNIQSEEEQHALTASISAILPKGVWGSNVGLSSLEEDDDGLFG